MRRDLKLNMSNLRAILAKVNAYKEELEQIETASAKFLEVIKEQDSKAYDKLSRLWEENVTQNESDLKEKLAIISELLNNYIVDMESYITPKDPGTMRRYWGNVVRSKAASERSGKYSGSYRSEYI